SKYGRMRECLIIDIDDFQFDILSLLIEGDFGELPNLDLFNVITYYSTYYNLKLSLFKTFSNFKISILNNLKDYISTQKLFKYLNIGHFIFNNFWSIPTGDHSIFRKYNIHSITITNTITNDPPKSNKRDNMYKL